MDFILNNSGLLFGFLLVAVFAIIGYFADKKDNSNKSNASYNRPSNMEQLNSNNIDVPSYSNVSVENHSSNNEDNVSGFNNKFINPINNAQVSDFQSETKNEFDNVNMNDYQNGSINELNNVNMNDYQNGSINELNSVNMNDSQSNTVDDFNSVNNSNNISETNNLVEEEIVPETVVFDDSVSNNQPVSQSQLFNENDFESLNISLEDLEKKNFDAMNKESLNDDGNFYYSNLEDSDSQNVVSDGSLDNTSVESSIDSSMNVGEMGVPKENIGVSANNSDSPMEVQSAEDLSTSIDNSVVVEDNLNSSINDNVIEDNYSHAFDGETQPMYQGDSNISDSNVDGLNGVTDNVTFRDDNSPVPELVDQPLDNNTYSSVSENNVNGQNDLSDDEIWKF